MSNLAPRYVALLKTIYSESCPVEEDPFHNDACWWCGRTLVIRDSLSDGRSCTVLIKHEPGCPWPEIEAIAKEEGW